MYRLLAAVLTTAALGGCGAGDERAEDPAPAAPTTAPPGPASRPERSPLADAVVELGSATYDPDAHRGAVRAPVALTIADLGIEAAPVVAVGVDERGELAVPPVDQVGWYRFGPAPGRP